MISPVQSKASKQQGQILVLMAMMSTTLIILFGMVVGIGHIIEAKMNLQNAVDLAAMAGASQQARYMNFISLVNYRMRQNYKFVLYDLYVTQSRFNGGLKHQVPVGGPAPGLYDQIDNSQGFTFGVCQQSYGYYPKVQQALNAGFALPSVYTGAFPMLNSVEPGQAVDQSTDMCQRVDASGLSIPPIMPSPILSFDPILLAINEIIGGLSAQAQMVCKQTGNQNKYYLEYITHQFIQRQLFQSQQLGVVLVAFSKAFDLQSGGVDNVLAGQGPANQAIAQTFRSNLISANSNSSISLQYLNPMETRGFVDNSNSSSDAATHYANVIFSGTNNSSDDFGKYFERQSVTISLPYAKFQEAPDGGCAVVVQNYESPLPGVVLGISRTRKGEHPKENSSDQPVKIPFEVVLQATVQPKLLFWPNSLTPTLVAVGAAKPFGSRVGPPAELSMEEVNGSSGLVPLNGAHANMSFYPGDTPTGGSMIPGVGHKYIIWNLLHYLPQNNGVNDYRPSAVNSGGDCLNSPDFLCYATAPTLYEGFFWNTYLYPSETNFAGSAAMQAVFPAEPEVTLTVSEPTLYALPDRFSTIPSNAQANTWHYTSFIGHNATFRDSNKPVFFADYASGLSSWSPDLAVMPYAPASVTKLDSSYATSGAGSGPTVSTNGRLGYQIKLASVQEVCNDINAGGGVNISSSNLQQYCDQTAEDALLH